MTVSRPRISQHDTQHSDALADIALNTLGLILIVMLIYVLLFRQTTRKIAAAAQASESRARNLQKIANEKQGLEQELEGLRSTASRYAKEQTDSQSRMAELKSRLEQEQSQRLSTADRLKEATDSIAALTAGKQKLSERNAELAQQLASSENGRERERESALRLQGQIRELESRIDELAEGSKLSGLWRFRNNVVQLVDHNDNTESVDWTIDYFLYLNVVDGKVTGILFGAHEIETADNEANSASYATISGTINSSGFLDVEMVFSQGSTDSGSEHLRCQFDGSEFVGRLESGRHRTGYRNYVGPTRGTRLTESVFR